MEKEDALSKIRAEFADKQYDEQTLGLINNFIEEFDSLFGKYVSREEVIRRIQENLDTVTFNHEFDDTETLGMYTISEKAKAIYLSKGIKNEEMIKATFFHEMLHCLSLDLEKGIFGFKKVVECEDFEDNSKRVVIGVGFNEGVTEYITRKRCEKYSPELERISYPILSEQIENLVDLIGEETLMNLTFNSPEQLSQQLEMDEWSENGFLEAFDSIWRREQKLYRDKLNKDQKTKHERLLESMFGENAAGGNAVGKDRAKETIISTYKSILLQQPITTVEEFNQMYRKILKYKEQLATETDITMSSVLQSKISEVIQSNGMRMEELIDELDEEPRRLLQRTNIVKLFMESSDEEKLDLLMDDDFKYEVLDAGEDGTLEELRERLVANTLPSGGEQISVKLYRMLTSGLAKKIKDKKYSLARIAVENIDMDGEYKSIFNLYYSGKDASEYIGTYSLNDDLELVEFSQNIPDEIRQSILQEHPEFAEGALLYSQGGEVVFYNGDGKYTRIDEYGDEYVSDGESEYFESELEYAQARLKRLMPGIKVGQPKICINAARRIEEILSETSQKGLRQEIVGLTGRITQEEIDEISKYISQDMDLDKRRQEALKTGLCIGD